VMDAAVYVAMYLGILAVRGLLVTETVQATTARIRLLLGWSGKAP